MCGSLVILQLNVDLVDDALERCGPGCDAVFQREDDHLCISDGVHCLASLQGLYDTSSRRLSPATAAAKGMREAL